MPGRCKYQYTPAEQYASPGIGEICGARTYHRRDVEEVIDQQDENGAINKIPTGRILPREVADPFCPRHGGTPNPNPDPDEEPAPPTLEQRVGSAAERADVAHERAQNAQQTANTLAGAVSSLDARVSELERRLSPSSGVSGGEPR